MPTGLESSSMFYVTKTHAHTNTHIHTRSDCHSRSYKKGKSLVVVYVGIVVGGCRCCWLPSFGSSHELQTTITENEKEQQTSHLRNGSWHMSGEQTTRFSQIPIICICIQSRCCAFYSSRFSLLFTSQKTLQSPFFPIHFSHIFLSKFDNSTFCLVFVFGFVVIVLIRHIRPSFASSWSLASHSACFARSIPFRSHAWKLHIYVCVGLCCAARFVRSPVWLTSRYTGSRSEWSIRKINVISSKVKKSDCISLGLMRPKRTQLLYSVMC